MRHSVIAAVAVIIAVLITLFGPIATVGAVPAIVVGSHDLIANRPGQTIQIYVTGGDLVAGMDFAAQIANGGPEAEAEGLIPPGTAIEGPAISGLDLVTDTIFAQNNMGQFGELPVGQYPQLAFASTVLNSGFVAAEGLIATLTIDTTGFTSGSFALSLTVADASTGFAGIAADITDGVINLVEGSISSGVDAGEDQEVHTGDIVQLEGGALDDSTGSLTYEWVQTEGPRVIILDVSSPTLSFTAPAVASNTELTFELRASDGSQTMTDTVKVMVLAQPAPDNGDDDNNDNDDDADTDDTDTTEESSTTGTFSWGTLTLGVGLLLLALWLIFFLLL